MKKLTFCLLFLLFTSPLYAAPPPGCTAKTVDSKISEKAGLLMRIVAPEISLFKMDFLGAILAYTTQYGMGRLNPILKKHFDHKRPCGCNGSFPSGHMLKYAASASYLHYRYGWQYGLPVYAVAFAFGYDRVRLKAHSWRDIFLTAAIANAIEYVLIPRYNKDVRYLPTFGTDKRKPKMVKGPIKLEFSPSITPQPKGMLFGLRATM